MAKWASSIVRLYGHVSHKRPVIQSTRAHLPSHKVKEVWATPKVSAASSIKVAAVSDSGIRDLGIWKISVPAKVVASTPSSETARLVTWYLVGACGKTFESEDGESPSSSWASWSFASSSSVKAVIRSRSASLYCDPSVMTWLFWPQKSCSLELLRQRSEQKLQDVHPNLPTTRCWFSHDSFWVCLTRLLSVCPNLRIV